MNNINDEVRLNLNSFKNEDIEIAIRSWIKVHYEIEVKIKIDAKYDEEITNQKEAPLNGKLNTERRCYFPKWYPGFTGKVEIICNSCEDYNKINGLIYGENRFKRILFGGNKEYEKYKLSGCKEELKTINCIYLEKYNSGSNWLIGSFYFFIDDFPELNKRKRNGEF